MNASTTISLQQVSLARGTTSIFRDLTLELNDHRIGLIGDNGAGKSSLFRLICGLDEPQSGTVLACGQDSRSRATGLVGMMFQNPDEQIIFPTVEEELALSLTATGTPRRSAREQARQWLASRGLEHWAERAIHSLSQGQRQHVCWLALVIATPRILLLDEPFASLDLPGQALLRHEIDQAPQHILVSTHLLDHVRDFARVIWLDQGCVRADGPGQEVCAAYETDVALRIAKRRPATTERPTGH